MPGIRERQELLRRRRQPQEGGRVDLRYSDLRLGQGSRLADRRHRERHLRAATRRRCRHLGSGRGRPRHGDLHHRGHSGARHARSAQQDEGQGSRRRQEDAAARPELPRPHHAGRNQDRHHAGPHPPQGPHRRGEPLRHAHLRSRGAAHRDRPRPVERGRHRRRPDQRLEAHRRDEGLQRRSGDRRRHHDRRDRRTRRGRRGPLVQGEHEEAGGRLHRRRHGASRQAHGPRRRADLGRCRHGRGQARHHGGIRLYRDPQLFGIGQATQSSYLRSSPAWFTTQERSARNSHCERFFNT
ncbi:hypothetical protein VARIO8X_160239 [Burkholderiales bacterium 8X]|nr:hypothetical protein VARIO8X_160239 [Burkholderiales bacterium 8X]